MLTLHMNGLRRARLASLACTAALLCALGARGQSPTPTPVWSEPDHKIRFDNGSVRVYEVNLPPGRSTLMHEHSADNFSVMFGTPEMTNEPLGGLAASFRPPTGTVLFTPAPKPYAHRVTASGPTPFHVAALELLEPPRGAPHANQRPQPLFGVVVENQRGRAYRYSLEPGQSTGAFPRSARTGVFAVTSGRISETAAGRAARLWDAEAGQFRWHESAEEVTVRNEGTTRIQLVEVEVF